MKSIYISLLLSPLLLPSNGFAQTKDPSDAESGFCFTCIFGGPSPASKNVAELKDVAVAAGADDCDSEKNNKIGLDSLKAVIESDKKNGKKVTETFLTPSSRTSTSVTYSFPEKTMKPGDSFYFVMPGDLQKSPVNFVVIGHRQDPQTETGTGTNGYDSNPGLSSLQVHGKNFPEKSSWRYWNGSASGKEGAKFAEARANLEMENLYEWTHYGSTGVDTKDSSNEGIRADAVKVVSVGTDAVQFGEITIKVLPPEADQKIEKIFTPGSKFSETIGNKAKFGGGQGYEGKFPNAVALRRKKGGNSPTPPPDLPDGWKIINGDTLSIPLPKGKNLSSFEVIGGDSHPDGIRNKDGGMGTPGWARASVGLESGGQTEWFVENENVPPEGLILGSPSRCKQTIKEGDRLLIKGSRDVFYIMGVRIGVKNP